MSDASFPHPFDPNRFIGTICEVTPAGAQANMPKAASPDGGWIHGHPSGGGRVGDFVIIEGGDVGTLARVVNVRLPGRDRLSVEPKSGVNGQPIASLQLLTTIDLVKVSALGGIARHPILGSRVYLAHPALLRWVSSQTSSGKKNEAVTISIGSFSSGEGFPVEATPERLFGRHCAVLGATGGGKSWTLARLVEQSARYRCKILMLDATGEFWPLQGAGIHHFGIAGHSCPDAQDDIVAVPHDELNEEDLFALFSPSGQSQAPKLRAAMKSLKLVRLASDDLKTTTLLKKAGQNRKDYIEAFRKHRDAIESPRANFDIRFLARQVDEECVRPSASSDQWGTADEQGRTWCVSLVNRIEATLTSKELSCILPAKDQPSLFQKFDTFLSSDARVMRVSLKHLSFAFGTREIIVNAIGRRIMEYGRAERFRTCPLLVVVDEAHQFLSRRLGDEHNRVTLDAFDLIAKEGRKYWLMLCLATQRPRDIPDGVMSQMGTLIVHRISNEADRIVVERAAGDIDRGAAAFLPTLAPGEAAVIGADFRVPLTVRVDSPHTKPDSTGPDFQGGWTEKAV